VRANLKMFKELVMQGPHMPGAHEPLGLPSQWDWETGRLIRGQRYHVIKSFVDADGDRHSPGEEWVFVGSMFSRLDDLLTLVVRSDSGEEWLVPLFWTHDAQREIIEHFGQYVAT
jgi:hypothetical protein